MQESPRACQAWADYVALGPDRSLEKLLERYRSVPSAPTNRLPTLKGWSAQYGWQNRLKAIADQAAQEAEARETEYRRSIMEAGYALKHERVKALNRVATVLYAEITTEDPAANRRWVKDVKQIGSGEDAERVDIERFNAAEVEQLRGVLDDIAKEKGDRVQRQDVTSDGKPLAIKAYLNVNLDGV